MGSIISSIKELIEEIVEEIIIIVTFILFWVTLAILGAIAVGSADDFRKSLDKGSEEREKATDAWEKLKILQWVTWIGIVLMILLLIVFVLFEIFGGSEVEGVAAVAEGSEASLVGLEGSANLEASNAGLEGAEELRQEKKKVSKILKKYKKYRGESRDEIAKSVSKYDKDIRTESVKLSSLAKSCKNGLYWSKYFANFSGLFDIIITVSLWGTSVSLFVVGYFFLVAALELNIAEKIVEGNGGEVTIPTGHRTTSIAAAIGIIPLGIILIWGFFHLVYKYMIKCPEATKENEKLLKKEKKLRKEIQKETKSADEENKKIHREISQRKRQRKEEIFEQKKRERMALAEKGIDPDKAKLERKKEIYNLRKEENKGWFSNVHSSHKSSHYERHRPVHHRPTKRHSKNSSLDVSSVYNHVSKNLSDENKEKIKSTFNSATGKGIEALSSKFLG